MMNKLNLEREMYENNENPRLKLNNNGNITVIGVGKENSEKEFTLMKFERKPPKNKEVLIEILYCGVCHSDFHIYFNEWKNTKYPIIAGHEIIGIVIYVGENVKKFKLGDYAVLGPNYNSCKSCNQCQNGSIQYCEYEVTETYNSYDRSYDGEKIPTGSITQGGFSNYIVANEDYLFTIPKNISNNILPYIAPLVCSGITMYTPLKNFEWNKNYKPRVGIVGIGGLGSIGLKIAKAMEYEVFALTRTKEKLQDSIRMGADVSLWTIDLDLLKKYNDTFDLIISTVPFQHDLNPYLELLKTEGLFWNVGNFFSNAVDLEIINRKNIKIEGSCSGNLQDTQKLIDLCVYNEIYPEIQLINMNQLSMVHKNILNSNVRYRYVVDVKTIYQI